MTQPKKPSHTQVVLALILCQVFWSLTFFFVKWGAGGIQEQLSPSSDWLAPLVFLVYRFSFSVFLIILLAPGVVRRLSWASLGYGTLINLPCLAGYLLQIYGLRDTSPGISSFLTCLAVIFVPLIAWACHIEKPSSTLWVGTVLALAGLVLLTKPWQGSFSWGALLTVGCAVAFSIQILLINLYTKRVDADAMSFFMMINAAVLSALFLFLLPGGAGLMTLPALKRLLGQPAIAWSLGLTALFGTAALMIMNRYQKHLAASRATLIYTVQPLLATSFSFLMCKFLMVPFAESITWNLIGGGVLILGGNLWVDSAKRDK